ncbi:glutamine-hydrolyzing GMP synthase [bacterium]|nr:glutamine-hydrolyzing GMP synthase [candidate division CSSED10-310 bacterium]
MNEKLEKIIILDFGSQYTQLIARRVREARVYCEILPFNASPEQLFMPEIAGLILSGGPASTIDPGSPRPHPSILRGKLPVLGICYGYQLIGREYGASVVKAPQREYGPAVLTVTRADRLLKDLKPGDTRKVWMSHEDYLNEQPEGFVTLARTGSSPHAVIADPARSIYGVQFHPEVTHSAYGAELIRNFVLDICGCKPVWTPQRFVAEAVAAIRGQVGRSKVICGLSGGVDSAVVAVLLKQAVGNQLIAVFVDNGILRDGEARQVEMYFGTILGDQFVKIDASDRFLRRLEGIDSPERKRKIIGEEFIRVFEEQAAEYGDLEFLAQGTLYPDVIESAPVRGPSATIKTHHNVGGLPEKMNLKLVEPLRFLFKDEVRQVGLSLGLPEEIVWRQPFPGPGLAVRILGEVTRERIRILQQADRIVREEISSAGAMRSIWQSFAVLLPVRTVGVMGDERTYEYVCAVRAVTSVDAMTADWARLPYEVLERISNRISNEVNGINRVVYDISSKPPATIEWE